MQIKELEKVLNDLSELFLELVRSLEKNCWSGSREKEQKVVVGGILNFDFESTTTIKKRLIPEEFSDKYRKWFSLCKGIIEVNGDKESLKEFNEIYISIIELQKDCYVSLKEQLDLIDLMNRQLFIINSLPEYLKGKSHNLKLTIASMLMGDELKEARLLLEKGFIRAAGALSGVILERHLKFMLNNAKPKIKYGEKATLGQLINKAEEKNVFEHSSIQKLKYLNSVRIACDHDKKAEPKSGEVNDLIEQTDRFIHFIDD